jgi:Carboxypeptidase regulatory-like domain
VKRVFAVLYLLLAVCPFGFAQGNDASLTGGVTDQSHAAVADAKVTVRNKSTNLTQSATTDPSGNYSFLSLPIGNYEVKVEQSGFETLSAELVLEAAQKARRDFELHVGQSQQTVTVESTAQGLSTEDASL